MNQVDLDNASSSVLDPSSLRNIAVQLAYDGTDLVGSQVQADGRTVQGELEAAWLKFTNERVRWTFAGRTDAGVHAWGQVANVRTGSQHNVATMQRALNALLPADVAVRSAWEVPYDFHARFSAVRRAYRYLLLLEPYRSPLWRHRAWHMREALNVDAMVEALLALLGEHDFAAFGSTPEGATVRDCFVAECHTFEQDGMHLVAIDLEANGFLRHMVRAIIGTLVLVGQGRYAINDMTRILDSRDRAQAGPTAPPHGLYLMSVTYPTL
jgi:tRNA pseudouridine38-40 synthase